MKLDRAGIETVLEICGRLAEPQGSPTNPNKHRYLSCREEAPRSLWNAIRSCSVFPKVINF